MLSDLKKIQIHTIIKKLENTSCINFWNYFKIIMTLSELTKVALEVNN